MALSASGLGSGIDINGLVSQLMAVERQPLTSLAKKEAGFQAKLSAFGQIKSSLSTLQSAAKALQDGDKFSGRTASVESVAGFTASAGSAAAVGNYTIQVEQLARTQRVATAADTSFVPNAGSAESPTTVTVTFGRIDAGSFVANEEAGKTIDFTGSTLEELRDAINQGELGVTANIIDNGSAKQLVVSAKDSGTEQAFQLSGSAGLVYDPSTAVDPGQPDVPAGSNSVYLLQAAQDAQLNVDGIRVTRASNTISDVLEGVTLTLNKESDTASNLGVGENLSSARSAIDAFVKAYNDVHSTLKNVTSYNPETKAAAALNGDSTARSLQSKLRDMVGSSLPGLGDISRLSDMGITFDKEGKLSVDNDKLDAALKAPSSTVATFFAGSSENKGLAATVVDGLKGYLDSDGLLESRNDGINSSIKLLGKQREALEFRLESVEKRYMAQFTALDGMIASMSQTSAYLSQQLASLSG